MASSLRGAPTGPAGWDEDNPALRRPHDTDFNRLAYEIYVRQADTDHGGYSITNVVITQPAWSTPTLQNGWVNWGSGNSDAAYFKDRQGMVHVQGFIKSGTITSNTVILTLPTGYRPNSTLRFLCGNWGTVAEVAILANGEVRCNGVNNNTGLSLDNIHFRAA